MKEIKDSRVANVAEILNAFYERVRENYVETEVDHDLIKRTCFA